MMNITAKRSEEEKRLSQLSANRRWRERNLEKDRECQRKYREANPDKLKIINRRSKLKRKFGISLEQFDVLLASQNSVCAICKTAETGERGWHVDHCHSSGVIRGILCHYCNTGLGLFKDNPVSLQNAIGYLNENRL